MSLNAPTTKPVSVEPAAIRPITEIKVIRTKDSSPGFWKYLDKEIARLTELEKIHGPNYSDY